MTTDPYKTLGVKRGATEPTIKKRFRRLAMQHHPDKNPGDAASAERFRAIQAAFDVLLDPESRAHFDATGEMPDPTKPALRSLAMSVLGNTLFAIMQGDINVGRDPAASDLIARIRSEIGKTLQSARNAIAENDRLKATLTAVADRFAAKDGGDNFLSNMARGPIADAERANESMRHNLVINEKALLLLANFEFKQKATLSNGMGVFTTAFRANGATR